MTKKGTSPEDLVKLTPYEITDILFSSHAFGWVRDRADASNSIHHCNLTLMFAEGLIKDDSKSKEDKIKLLKDLKDVLAGVSKKMEEQK